MCVQLLCDHTIKHPAASGAALFPQEAPTGKCNNLIIKCILIYINFDFILFCFFQQWQPKMKTFQLAVVLLIVCISSCKPALSPKVVLIMLTLSYINYVYECIPASALKCNHCVPGSIGGTCFTTVETCQRPNDVCAYVISTFPSKKRTHLEELEVLLVDFAITLLAILVFCNFFPSSLQGTPTSRGAWRHRTPSLCSLYPPTRSSHVQLIAATDLLMLIGIKRQCIMIKKNFLIICPEGS